MTKKIEPNDVAAAARPLPTECASTSRLHDKRSTVHSCSMCCIITEAAT